MHTDKIDMTRESGRTGRRIRNGFIILLILAAGAGAGWYYLQTQDQIKGLERQLAYARSGMRTEVMHTLQAHDSALLALAMEPLSWAVRNELLNQNMEKLNQYLYAFVQQPQIELVMLVGEDGTIVASSNKKLEEQPFSEVTGTTWKLVDKLEMNATDSLIQIFQPVMGFDRRIGTIYCTYRIDRIRSLPASLQEMPRQ